MKDEKYDSMELYRILRKLSKRDILKYSKMKCEHRHSLISHPKCLLKELGKVDRIGYLDIETSNLDANAGFITSYCIKVRGEKKIYGRTITKEEILSGDFDKQIVKDLCEDLKNFDTVVGYYSTGFDIPYIRTQAVHHGIDFPVYSTVKHIDVYYMIKHRFKLTRNRMQTACDYFGIPSKGHALTPNWWKLAAIGDKKALAWTWEHNVEDVISLELLHNKVSSYVKETNKSI